MATDTPPSSASKPEGREPPKAVVSRLSLYLRELQRLARDGEETTSSGVLGALLGITDAQVRKDLAYFGQFGLPGVGYRTAELVKAIKRILGTDRQWVVALVGVGNLGRALLGYKGFNPQGFRIAAAFDADMSKVGQTVGGVVVHPLDQLEQLVQERGVTLGLIASPAEAAQEIADRLVTAGVSGILNFAPVTLSLPEGVSLVGVDLATEMEQLSYSVAKALDLSADAPRDEESLSAANHAAEDAADAGG
ncbi:MAG: redox-sensing transcriptional repressor Rex [Planctomycetota bacterium]